MNILIVASSLNPHSRSRYLARELERRWSGSDLNVEVLDLKDVDLPMCDGSSVYSDPRTASVQALANKADGIVFASPVYVYSVNAAMKNFVELAGQSMKGKIAGFLCAAGGRMSYMSVMSLANSLMLDFRMYVLPRFVYVAAEDWEGDKLTEEVVHRIGEFATSFEDFVRRLKMPEVEER